ncbi:coiled-coil domain-containing protein [Blattabacterium cuenoti]|uniref:hypothetical protein n=1 Tax=Blattabacterium cuenoti TaxID=1653831 RepID=UPI00163BAD23|nr:hypothetical protein [Blattabacterium cuenoti]
MKTTLKFPIPIIFFTLGFLISCNDEVTNSVMEEDPYLTYKIVEEETGVNNKPSVKKSYPPPIDSSDSFYSYSYPISTYTNTNTNTTINDTKKDDYKDDLLIVEELSQKIKNIGKEIESLEKESVKYNDEFSNIIDLQKGTLDEMVKMKKIIRFQSKNYEKVNKAKKSFEDQKKLAINRIEIIKDKNLFINKFNKSIREKKNKKISMQNQIKNFLIKRKKQIS